MQTHQEIVIASDRISLGVVPALGARISFITVGGVDLLVRRHSAPETDGPLGWGSYPMVPWAGRIRDGKLRFRDRIHDLPKNLGGHAIHGVGFTSPWTVTASDATAIELELSMPTDVRWPFGGVAHQRIAVHDDLIALAMSVTATTTAFPASIGWHPWFRKPERLDFRPTAMYRRDEHGITVDELVSVPPGPWDDCFVNEAPIGVVIDGVELSLRSPCTDWVVFDERPWATCIEPQTAPPDALNMRPQVLEPGDTLSARYDLQVTSAPAGDG